MSFFKRLFGISDSNRGEIFTKVNDQTWVSTKGEVINQVSDDVSISPKGTVYNRVSDNTVVGSEPFSLIHPIRRAETQGSAAFTPLPS